MNIDRTTPETDALISVGLENADRECVPADFARKLERERDEALIDRANGDIATMTINHYERILRERDMAEDERIDLAQQLRSEKERHAKCQNERDEARAVAHDLAVIASHCLGWHDHETGEAAERISSVLKRWKGQQ